MHSSALHHVTDAFARTCFCLSVASAVTLFVYLPPLAQAPIDDVTEDASPLIEVGVFTDAGFVPATVVPLVVGTAFGWRLRVSDDRPIAFEETLRAPAAPREWIGDGFSISDDGTTATLSDVIWPESGDVHHAWIITEGDPAGPHELRVRIEGGAEQVVRFVVR